MSAIDILKRLMAMRPAGKTVEGDFGQITPDGRQLPGVMSAAPNTAEHLPSQQPVQQPAGMDPSGMPPDTLSVRPRVVPGQPVQEANPVTMGVKPYSETGDTTDYSDPRQRINYIENKDYSIIKDPETGKVIHRGKDRDKKWSLGEKIGAALLGAFNGTGAVPAAMDRNYFEKLQDRRDLNEAYGSVQRQQKMRQGDLQNEEQQLQNQYLAVKPTMEQQKIDNTADAKRREIELKTRTQKFKEGDRLEYYRLEREKLQALQENRTDLYELAVRRQAEIERNNKTNNDLRERQVTTQEKRAALAVQNAGSSGVGQGGRSGATKVLDPKKMENWFKFAQGLDDKFNNGEIDENRYNNMIKLMEAKIAQESQ